MIAITIDYRSGRDDYGRAFAPIVRGCVRCDDCGADGKADYLAGEDDRFGEGLLVARATGEGWKQYLDGRVSRLRCPACVTRREAAQAPAGTQLAIGGLG